MGADDGRILQRFEFPGGGFVEIKVSHDVDAELALQIIETSLPTVKAITAVAEKARPPQGSSGVAVVEDGRMIDDQTKKLGEIA